MAFFGEARRSGSWPILPHTRLPSGTLAKIDQLAGRYPSRYRARTAILIDAINALHRERFPEEEPDP